jgi:hypothetical protein
MRLLTLGGPPEPELALSWPLLCAEISLRSSENALLIPAALLWQKPDAEVGART